MIRKIQIFLTLAAVAISSTACLDKYPDDAILDYKAITTLSDAEQAVTGIYAAFKSASLYSGVMTLCPDIQTDLVYAVEGYSNTYGDIWRWEILANNSNVEAVYASLYTVIGRCNFFFAYVERLRATLTVDDDLDALLELEGDVYFARALAYSELIKLYCKAYNPETADSDLGVALIDDYYNPGRPTRATLEESYQFVLKDLAKAEEYIQRESNLYVSYFTKSAVNALYARIYLYMYRFEKAIEYSTEAIEYARKLYNGEQVALSSANVAYSSTQSLYEYEWTNDAAYDIIWRVGFNTTSYGGALGRVFLNYNFVTYTPDYVPASWVINAYSNSDLRKTTFFESIQTSYSHGLYWPLLIKYRGNVTFREQSILHVNMPKPFRLSEQYLIRAEAYCRLDENVDLEGNAAPKNVEYTKAGKDITTLRAARYTSYGSTSISKDTWLDEISNERMRELYMEGFRLNDLKRWGKGFERTPQQSSVAEGSRLKITADNPLFVWPIPQHELDTPDADIQPNESNK